MLLTWRQYLWGIRLSFLLFDDSWWWELEGWPAWDFSSSSLSIVMIFLLFELDWSDGDESAITTTSLSSNSTFVSAISFFSITSTFLEESFFSLPWSNSFPSPGVKLAFWFWEVPFVDMLPTGLEDLLIETGLWEFTCFAFGWWFCLLFW